MTNMFNLLNMSSMTSMTIALRRITMPLIALAFTLTSALTLVPSPVSAATVPGICPPNFVDDSQTVSATCAGLFVNVVVTPDTYGTVAANDNPLSAGITNTGTADDDINDIWLTYIIAASSPGHSVIDLTYGGDLSSLTNHLFLDGREIDSTNTSAVISGLTDGSTLTFWELTGQGNWYSSKSSENVDGLHYFWISQNADTPEPASAALLGLGLVAIGCGARKRCRG